MEKREGERASSDDASTIYVGDLSPKTLDSDLFRLFSSVGEVLRIKLIKRVDPLSSFAFVTFSSEEEAKRALKEYNHHELHTRQIRLSSIIGKDEKLSEGNIFVKNLPEDFTSKDLDEAFSMFGKIVSCKVATTLAGKSKGYGFVQFEKKKSARLALKNCSGMMLSGRAITVEPYNTEIKKRGSQSKSSAVFTNCFIKNFPPETKEEDLRSLLERHGRVTSLHFPTKPDGSVKGFAFANFESHEAALRAIENLHGTHPFNTPEELERREFAVEPFYIQKGQRKEEREEELRKTFERLSMQGQNYKRNLYVTNIPEGFGRDELLTVFREFGSIISLSVNTDAMNSRKQYAYVCYSTPEEASIAVERGNEIYLDGNKLQVSYFKNKLERMQDKELNEVTYRPMPYVYNHAVNFSPSDSYRYERPSTGSASSRVSNGSDRLYSLVLATAPSFQSQWKGFGVSNEVEFANKVTKILYNKPEEEIRNMIKLNFVLNENIESTIKKGRSSEDPNKK
jgi:polyadenylate-binding protein